MINSRQLFQSITVAMLCLSMTAEAQRGRGGGGRGGGRGGGGFRGGGGGGFRGGGMSSRGFSRPSVTRPAGGGGGIRPAQLPANRPNGGINRPNGGINVGNGGNINRGGINVDRGNINVNRPVNVGDGDWDNNYGPGWGCCYHPVARAAAVTAAAVATAAAVGSVVYTLPPSCTVTVVNGITYEQCGSTWYQPQFVGDETSYVVVNPP